MPIKRKVVAVIMMTSLVVLLLTLGAFLVYDLVTYRRGMIRNLSDTSSIVAANSAPALAAREERAAAQILAALRVNPHILAAALYDEKGYIFTRYPSARPISTFPLFPGQPGYEFQAGRLVFFEPVHNGQTQLGTLYLQSDLYPLYLRLRLYLGMALIVLAAALVVAVLLSTLLQRRITNSILALTEVAKAVSERNDYSVRAPRAGPDEVGLLTDAFNQMLAHIQQQTLSLRRNEELRSFLVATVESSDDAIIGKDLHGRVVSWNAGATRLFGYTAAEMIGQPITRLQAPDRPEEEDQILKEVCRGGIRHFETVRLRKDGRPLQISLTVSPIKNAQGDILGVSSIGRDITERKQAEEQLRRLTAELEQRVQERTAELTATNRELEAFTYSAAHDLRAPLRHVEAFGRILLEDFQGDFPAEAEQYLHAMCRSSRNMSQLIDDLLNLARIGRQELERVPVDLAQVVEEVRADLANETKGRSMDWRLHPLPVVDCDPGLIKQVFANLLANAVKYSRPRAVAIIEIGCQVHDGSAALFVRDNGVGFNMKHAPKLFGVFQRLHPAEEFEGTGVGLATVDRIVRKHGGRVWAEAAVDAGATFYFTLEGLNRVTPATATPALA